MSGSGDAAPYEAWQRKYSTEHHKGWSAAALKWPPGKESWDALQVPNVSAAGDREGPRGRAGDAGPPGR
ncbi:hypothetical protein [Actinacidiphila sp. bgisy144]|uniref:hypothetical protein n=1 Tax=Actinacidiphila sp. bgisy144 TaxID=3413791 RepID=UPI003EBE461B